MQSEGKVSTTSLPVRQIFVQAFKALSLIHVAVEQIFIEEV